MKVLKKWQIYGDYDEYLSWVSMLYDEYYEESQKIYDIYLDD
jgi:hypothetical protein